MDAKTQEQINTVFEKLVDIRTEIVEIRGRTEKEEHKFTLTMVWIGVLQSLAWLQRLSRDL